MLVIEPMQDVQQTGARCFQAEEIVVGVQRQVANT